MHFKRFLEILHEKCDASIDYRVRSHRPNKPHLSFVRSFVFDVTLIKKEKKERGKDLNHLDKF